MILNKEPLSMAESTGYIEKETGKETLAFIKKFVKINAKDAKALREKIKDMDLMKVNDEHITKVIDLLPQNTEDLNKIFTDVGLDEDENNKILDAIKEFK